MTIFFNLFELSEFDGLVSRIANQTKQNLDGIRLDTSSWKQQFHEAMNVNGGDIDEASAFDYIMHFLSFFWKVILLFYFVLYTAITLCQTHPAASVMKGHEMTNAKQFKRVNLCMYKTLNEKHT